MELRTILAGVDFSAPSALAFGEAVALAREFGARLHVLHCYEIPVPGVAEYQVAIPDAIWERVRRAAAEGVDELVEKARVAGVDVEGEVREGPPSRTIAATAGRIGADLVVLGTHGHRGVERWLLGSVAERTLRTAPCHVLTLKARRSGAASAPSGGPSTTLRRVLVATDFSEHSRRTEAVAIELCTRFDAELHLVHAFGLPSVVGAPYDVVLTGAVLDEAEASARRSLDEAAGRASAAGVSEKAHLARTPAADAIVELAKELNVDLVVMGTHGHTGVKHALLGSVAERTLRLAPCSVLTVKAATKP